MLTPDVDSYVDVAEADEYFSKRYGYDQWALLPVDTREQALRSAVTKLDFSCSWDGDLCAEDQPLAFPRTAQDCNTPQGVKDAQCELAYLMITAGGANVKEENPLKKLKAGSVELEWSDRISPVDPLSSGLVTDLLSQYGTCLSGGSTRLIPVERG
jgi:hypothetical protein